MIKKHNHSSCVSKSTIIHTYNAAGAKLTKTVTETGKPIKTVAYKYGFLFENEVLKEFATPEGRIVAKTGAFQFQYHYKDHLGNVRMTFAGEEPLLGTMKLTAELDSAKKEEKDFTNVSQVQSSDKSLEGSMSAQITENQAVSSRVVKVLKGQKLVVEAFATFDKPEILTEGESLNKTNKVANIAANAATLLSIQDVYAVVCVRTNHSTSTSNLPKETTFFSLIVYIFLNNL